MAHLGTNGVDGKPAEGTAFRSLPRIAVVGTLLRRHEAFRRHLGQAPGTPDFPLPCGLGLNLGYSFAAVYSGEAETPPGHASFQQSICPISEPGSHSLHPSMVTELCRRIYLGRS